MKLIQLEESSELEEDSSLIDSQTNHGDEETSVSPPRNPHISAIETPNTISAHSIKENINEAIKNIS